MKVIVAICLLLLVISSARSANLFYPARISFEAKSERLKESSHETNPDRAIKFEITLNAPVARVWHAWTTREGIRSFFARDCILDLRTFGKYDILFTPEAPAGQRGAENNLILAIQEQKILSFTWDAPRHLPAIRAQRTTVVLRFFALAKNTTKLRFVQSGWGERKEWDEAFEYFCEPGERLFCRNSSIASRLVRLIGTTAPWS